MNRLERKHEERLLGKLRSSICFIDVGGGDAPQPDPAIGKAAEANAEIGREALQFSREQYSDAKARQAKFDPIVEQVIQQQLRLGDKNEAAADDYLNYMKSTFRPIEEGLAKEANEFDTEAKRAELAGKAGADVEQAAAASDAAARRDAARYGINPSDGAFAENLAGSSLNKTIMKIGAMGKARTDARAEGRALKFDVAALGRNLPGAGATASTVAMNAGNTAVNNAAMPGNVARADASAMLSGMGTAVGANTQAGNLYSNIFQGRMQGYQADQTAQAGLYSGLGQLGGMALYSGMKAARGGIIRKKKVVRKGYAAGGIVRGPGDGTVDTVPAMVDGKEPAALANGEGVLNEGAVAVVGEDFVHRVNKVGLMVQAARGGVAQARRGVQRV